MTDNDQILRGSVLERLNLSEHDAEERDWRSGANELARIRKYVEALPAVTVGVKPLVWQDAKFSDKWGRWTADTIFGQYEVLEYSNGTFGWNICFHDPDISALQYSAKSIEAAKAAAQQDYEARILASLEPAAPDLSDPATVHANMLRGTIAKPTVEQIIHLYGVDALAKALAPVIVREAALTPTPVDASQPADPAVNAPDPAAIWEALEACRIIDEAVKEGHESVSELVLHLLSAAEPARTALALIAKGAAE